MEAVDDAPGRQQQLGLPVEMLVEIMVESCSCGLGSMMGGICASVVAAGPMVESCSCGLGSMMGGICASVVAAGPQPALGEVVSASSQDGDRGHDVSILMAVIGPVGR